MEEENIENIVWVCEECTDERKQNTQKKLNDVAILQLKEKVEKNQGVWFKVALSHNDKTEHVWIKVSDINLADRTFTGLIDNDIIFVFEKYSYEDVITLSFDEIEEVIGQ